MLLTLLAFLLVLGPIILFHEIGHFVAAKLTGVRVEEFGIGWPPQLFRIWTSPSRLRVANIPLVTPRNFALPNTLKAGQYVDVIASEGKEDTLTINKLDVLDPEHDDLMPQHETIDQGIHIRGRLTDLDLGTAYTLNWIPVGGFCRMTGEEDPGDPRSLAAQPKRSRLAVLLSGPVVNLLLAILLFSLSYLSGFPEPQGTNVTIKDIAPNSPAAEAGLQAGDIVLQANGIPMESTDELIELTNAHTEQTIQLTLEREGQRIEKSVWVRDQSTDGRIGITISNQAQGYVLRRSSVTEALAMGLDEFWYSLNQTIRLPAMILRGQIGAQEVRPLGPLAISQIAGDAIERSNQEQSLFSVLYFAGAISMALGYTNLLPLPALDGGRILFVLIEALRGRRIDPAKEGAVHLIGMMLLLGLLLVVTFQELANPVLSPF